MTYSDSAFSSQTVNGTNISTQSLQKTLAQEVAFSGIGIHTGNEVSLKFCPAKANTGLVFQRVDLPSKPLIPATVEYVQDTSRATTIGIGQAQVHTVEHILAAFHATGIDNAVIQLNAAEPPVADGSSAPFLELIEQAGLVSLEESRPILKLTQPVYLDCGKIQIVAVPADEFKISYTLHYPQVKSIGSQFHSLVVNHESFKTEIADSRTFALYQELKTLMDAGLIRGGSLDNAVVIQDDAIFSKEGLRYPNEMVRHKILDVIGDLTLVGFGFHAHIISICSGHATNVAFAKKLLNQLTMENH